MDRRAALTPWILAEINRDRKQRSTPFEIEDFMPQKRRKKRALNPAQMAALIEANNVWLGGADARQKVIRASDEEKAAFLARLKGGEPPCRPSQN